MASSINSTSTGNGGLVSTGDDSGILNIQTNETTAITVDASQNVGIGTASPSYKLDVQSSAAGVPFVRVYNSASHEATIRYTTQHSASSDYKVGASITVANAFEIYSVAAATSRMVIDSSGNLLVGRTSTVTNPASSGAIVYASSGYSTTDGTTTANYTKDRIYFNATNFYVLNGSSTGVVLPSGNTSWSSQSDERTKDIIEPIKNATQKLSDLRCVIGKYKTDDLNKRRVFLIAQDVLKVLPEAVTELDDKNKTLALSYNDIIPLLTAALQETKALLDTQAETINALTARIVALESK